LLDRRSRVRFLIGETATLIFLRLPCTTLDFHCIHCIHCILCTAAIEDRESSAMFMCMSDTTTAADRDRRGRFLTGAKPGPGRPRGARSRLTESFLDDLSCAWSEHGKEALRKCAVEEPSTFVRVVSQLLPRDIDLSLTADVNLFAASFETACQALGVEAPVKRRPLQGRKVEVIEHDPQR
jgi:hypothetical protein